MVWHTEISQDSVEYVPPKFVKALQPQKVPEGEAVVFHVEVESVPEAAFTWQQHGTTIQVPYLFLSFPIVFNSVLLNRWLRHSNSGKSVEVNM